MGSSKEKRGRRKLRLPKGWYREAGSPLSKEEISTKLEGLYRMGQSQWWSLAALRKHQFSQLQDLLVHTWCTVPYYRSSLESLGYFLTDNLGTVNGPLKFRKFLLQS